MGCSCNLFGRMISVTSHRSHDGISGKSKKKLKKGRRGGPMDEDEEDDNFGSHWSPHPALPPACHDAQSMARSVMYSNDSPVVVMQATATGYSAAPTTTSYAYASPAVAPVVLEQQAPPPSKSRVRFALPVGSSRHNDEPVIAHPVGASATADTYYQHPQHDHHQLVQQQHSSSHNQQVIRHDDTAVTGPAGCGMYQTPPLQYMHPAGGPPEYGHYGYSYPTPRREAVYRIGTDANRFSMFSDENPNACSIM